MILSSRVFINRVWTKIFLIAIITFIFYSVVHGQEVDHWETIVETGQSVKYRVPSSAVPATWITGAYDDSDWDDGISGIGYEDDDDNTIISNCYSVFVRYRFSIAELSAIEALILDMDFDDGFVAYLNGREIARNNMGEAFSPTYWNQLSDGVINELPPGSYRYFIAKEKLDMLAQGENTLCIEVHNQDFNSSDLSSNTFLSAGINNSNTYFNPTPSWFIPPATYPSILPIMVINTHGQNIVDDPRVNADMGLINYWPAAINSIDSVYNEYDGKITIEIRGSSSQYKFEKKSFTFETQTESGANNNVSLLGLPRENDFVLYGPYSDKSLLRNVLTYSIYKAMGRWAPGTRMIDLYINNDYRGIYVLTEKVKQDKYRVNIKEPSEADITGGYILQVDRTSSLMSNEYWTSPVIPPISGFPRNTFEYFDPKAEDLTPVQTKYLRNWINNLDLVLANANYKDPINGYGAYLNVGSFVDYLILHEFNKDVDAYWLSTFFYKESDEKGGKLHAGPPWDYNLTYGNMNYGGDVQETHNWMYPRTIGRYWWSRLMYDSSFKNRVACRWGELKESILNEERLNYIIDSCIVDMGASIEHNFDRWPVMGTYVWPNNFVGDTYEEEITFLKVWIADRLSWLDQQWNNTCIDTGDELSLIQVPSTLLISPNPSKLINTRVQIPNHIPGDYHISLFDISGREVYDTKQHLDQFSGNIFLEDLSYLESGIYMLRIVGEGKVYSGKLIRR